MLYLQVSNDSILVGLDYILDVMMKSLTLPALKLILSYHFLSSFILSFLPLFYYVTDWMETFEG